MNRAAVRFEIGRITLHGLAPAHRARFVDALRAGLTEIGTAGDWSGVASRRLGRIDAGELRPGTSPEDAARLVAARVRAAVAPDRSNERPR